MNLMPDPKVMKKIFAASAAILSVGIVVSIASHIVPELRSNLLILGLIAGRYAVEKVESVIAKKIS